MTSETGFIYESKDVQGLFMTEYEYLWCSYTTYGYTKFSWCECNLILNSETFEDK